MVARRALKLGAKSFSDAPRAKTGVVVVLATLDASGGKRVVAEESGLVPGAVADFACTGLRASSSGGACLSRASPANLGALRIGVTTGAVAAEDADDTIRGNELEGGGADGELLLTTGTLLATGVVVTVDPGEDDGGDDTIGAVGADTLGVVDGDDGDDGDGPDVVGGAGDDPPPVIGDDDPPFGGDDPPLGGDDVIGAEDRGGPSFGDAIVVGEDGPGETEELSRGCGADASPRGPDTTG